MLWISAAAIYLIGAIVTGIVVNQEAEGNWRFALIAAAIWPIILILGLIDDLISRFKR